MVNYKGYVDTILEELAPQKCELLEIIHHLESQQQDKHDFRIVVAGGFSSGKSAFINHLLQSNVAVEGTTPTTRCSTEYFFSHEKCWITDGKSISETSYRDMSSCKGGTAHFRVGVPSEFLKNGVLIIDTPGYGDNQSDNDNATREIKKCDILFWLVNVTDGTFHGSELDALVEATKLAEGRKPLAVFLTQTDMLKPNKSMTVKNVLDTIREKIISQLQARGLRLVHAPQAVSIKNIQDVVSSVRALIKDQDDVIIRIVDECKEEALRAFQTREENLQKRLTEYRNAIHVKCQDGIRYLLEQKKEQEQRLGKTERARMEEFNHELVNIVRRHFDQIGVNVDLNNEAIVSQMSKGGWIWDDYEALFKGTLDFLHAQELYEQIGKLLAQYSDYCGTPYQCEGTILAVLNKISDSIHNSKVGRWSWENEKKARSDVAKQVENVLCSNSESLAKDIFLKEFRPPELKWSSLNICTMRRNLKEIDTAATRLNNEIQDIEHLSRQTTSFILRKGEC